MALYGHRMSYWEFEECCRDDAANWKAAGWTYDSLTEEDILDDFPEDFFETCEDDSGVNYYNEDYFTPEQFADRILDCLYELEQEKAKKANDPDDLDYLYYLDETD